MTYGLVYFGRKSKSTLDDQQENYQKYNMKEFIKNLKSFGRFLWATKKIYHRKIDVKG